MTEGNKDLLLPTSPGRAFRSRWLMRLYNSSRGRSSRIGKMRYDLSMEGLERNELKGLPLASLTDNARIRRIGFWRSTFQNILDPVAGQIVNSICFQSAVHLSAISSGTSGNSSVCIIDFRYRPVPPDTITILFLERVYPRWPMHLSHIDQLNKAHECSHVQWGDEELPWVALRWVYQRRYWVLRRPAWNRHWQFPFGNVSRVNRYHGFSHACWAADHYQKFIRHVVALRGKIGWKLCIILS